MKNSVKLAAYVLTLSMVFGWNPMPAYAEPETSQTESQETGEVTGSGQDDTAVLSSDSSLSSIEVAQGRLVPDFYPDQLTYTMQVANEVERITLRANTASSTAKKTITGTGDLKVGDNMIVIRVTAQDGSVTIYQIAVTRQEAPETTGQGEGEVSSDASAGEITSAPGDPAAENTDTSDAEPGAENTDASNAESGDENADVSNGGSGDENADASNAESDDEDSAEENLPGQDAEQNVSESGEASEITGGKEEDQFIISTEKTSQINWKKTVTDVISRYRIYVYLGGTGLVLILMIILCVLLLKKTEDDEEDLEEPEEDLENDEDPEDEDVPAEDESGSDEEYSLKEAAATDENPSAKDVTDAAEKISVENERYKTEDIPAETGWDHGDDLRAEDLVQIEAAITAEISAGIAESDAAETKDGNLDEDDFDLFEVITVASDPEDDSDDDFDILNL